MRAASLFPLRSLAWLLAGAVLAAGQPVRTAEEENFEALLATKRLAGTPAELREAVLRLLFDSEHHAFTQTIRVGRAPDGSDAVETVERYDPSQPPDAQWSLDRLRGKTPTADETARWIERKRRTDPSALNLEDIFDFPRAEFVVETDTGLQFNVPLGKALGRQFPQEEVFAVFSIPRVRPVVGGVMMMSREIPLTQRPLPPWAKSRPSPPSLRRFQIGVAMLFANKDAAPPAALLRVVGTTGLRWTGADGFREVKWSDVRRVKLYDERFGVKIGPLQTLGF